MARRGPSQNHTTLINDLCKDITDVYFNDLKTQVKAKEFGGLRAGEIEKLKDFRDLLDKLEKKRIFKPGNYNKLKELFEKVEFGDGIDTLEAAIGNEGNAEPMDQGDAQHPNVNNNRSSGLSSHQLQAQHVVGQYSHAPYPSSGPTAMPHRSRDQDDANPILAEGDDLYAKGRGYLLFINNFVEKGAEKRREGATVDEKNLRSVFQDFIKTFAIHIRNDLTKHELIQVLTNVSEELGRSNYKSFFFIICSHGERKEIEDSNGQKAYKEGFLTIDEELVTEDEVTEMFEAHKVPSLKGCPKVFIFQCCRGRAHGRGTLDRADSTEVSAAAFSAGAPIDRSDDVQPRPVNLPRNADMLIAHSTSKGTKAWRNNVDGSWFIKCFCDTVKLYHKRDHLLDMLVRVNAQVAERESTEGGAKQMPCQVSTFTKKFKLGE